MTFSYSQQKELMVLLGELCDGTLDDQGQAAIEAILLENGEARRIYRRYLNLHATLKQYHINKPFGREHRESQEPISPILGFLGNSIQRGVDFFMKAAPFSIIVTIIFPLLCVVIPAIQIFRHEVKVKQIYTVAKLSKTYDCVWGPSSYRLATGENLLTHQRLDLREGLAELTLTNGTNVILEGPAVLDLVSAGRVKLYNGRLTAKVPRQAIGFSVETPDAVIVDLGTEFGVVADAAGWSETEVFDGKVKARPSWAGKQGTDTSAEKESGFRQLTAGQTARLDRKNKTVKIMSNSRETSRFVRQMPTSKTVKFQQGVAGYHGTRATFIRDCVRGKDTLNGYIGAEEDELDNTNNNYGTHVHLLAAMKTEKDGGLPEKSRILIAFDDIFGDRNDQIPPNATIISATLKLRTTVDCSSRSRTPHSLYEISEDWQEDSVTWKSFGNGGQIGKQYHPREIAEFTPGRRNKFFKIDVTRSLRRWSKGVPNHGWFLVNREFDRSHFESDDAKVIKKRPRLVVKYKIPD